MELQLVDGAPVVKSRSMNLWPIQPHLKVFQERFVSELEQLHDVQVNIGDVNISVQRVLLHGHLADLVAKAPSLCFCQFNGKSGCSICLHPGKRIQQGRESIQIYPYSIEQPPKWRHAQTLLQAQVAERTGKAVFGGKIL